MCVYVYLSHYITANYVERMTEEDKQKAVEKMKEEEEAAEEVDVGGAREISRQ